MKNLTKSLTTVSTAFLFVACQDEPRVSLLDVAVVPATVVGEVTLVERCPISAELAGSLMTTPSIGAPEQVEAEDEPVLEFLTVSVVAIGPPGVGLYGPDNGEDSLGGTVSGARLRFGEDSSGGLESAALGGVSLPSTDWVDEEVRAECPIANELAGYRGASGKGPPVTIAFESEEACVTLSQGQQPRLQDRQLTTECFPREEADARLIWLED